MKNKIMQVFQSGEGVFQLTPTWVPRGFNKPGKRLKLHPDDYFSFGMERGGICERWLGSVTVALNGPKTGAHEGMSYVLADIETKETFLFADAVEVLGSDLIGKELKKKYGTWPTFAKIYDYENPLFHHLHLDEASANKIGKHGKPEAYYFPLQYNSYLGNFPLTYFGFDPSTKKEDVLKALEHYDTEDNRITELSRAYRIQLGTGWYTPAGVIHAPASVVTYEPQWNSDVNTIMENVTMGEVNARNMLTDCVPEESKNNINKIFELIDWEESTRPDYKETYFRPPVLRANSPAGSTENWVSYANPWIASKKITVDPSTKVVIKDAACYCALVVQGHGTFGKFDCEAPNMLRFEDISGDEFFVSHDSAGKGITITNTSKYEPIVILQNFANNNPDVPSSI